MTPRPDARLSIIVPVLNEGGILGAFLRSLQPLRQAGHEILLVDGGSDDDTPAQAAGLVDRLLETAPGRGLQMNAGARAATGEVLWFVHADSTVPPGAAGSILRGLEERQRLWGWFDLVLTGPGPVYRLVERLINLRSRVTRIATGDQGLFVRRSAFFLVGGYPAAPLMEDIVLSRRLKRLGAPLVLGPPLGTSARRWESRGALRTILLMWRLRLAFALGADPARLARRYGLCSTPKPES